MLPCYPYTVTVSATVVFEAHTWCCANARETAWEYGGDVILEPGSPTNSSVDFAFQDQHVAALFKIMFCGYLVEQIGDRWEM